MTDKPRGIMERLSDVSACDPGCEGRCVECPDDVIRDAKAEILALRQRAEAAEKRVAEREAAVIVLRDAGQRAVAELEARVAELQAALRPFVKEAPRTYLTHQVQVFVSVGEWRAAAALAKGGAG